MFRHLKHVVPLIIVDEQNLPFGRPDEHKAELPIRVVELVDNEEPREEPAEEIDLDDEDVDLIPARPVVKPAKKREVHRADGDDAIRCFAEMSDDARYKRFWNIVSQLAWKNRSEREMPRRTVSAWVNRLSSLEKLVFVKIYPKMRDDLVGLLDMVYLTVDMHDNQAKANVAGHIIALGHVTYKEFCEAPLLAEWLINENEYQAFDKCFSEEFPID